MYDNKFFNHNDFRRLLLRKDYLYQDKKGNVYLTNMDYQSYPAWMCTILNNRKLTADILSGHADNFMSTQSSTDKSSSQENDFSRNDGGVNGAGRNTPISARTVSGDPENESINVSVEGWCCI